MSRLKTLFIFICILIVTTSCGLIPTGNEKEERSSNQKTVLKDIDNAKFIVGFSNTLDRGSEIGVYGEDGIKMDSLELKDGINFTMSSHNKNNTFFLSNRSNNHLMIDNKTGKINKINEKSLSKTTEDEGAFFINSSDGYIIHDINVGYTDKGLESELVYWKGNSRKNKKQIKLDGELGSAIVAKNKIYVISSDEESMSILSINPETNKQENKASIPNKRIYFMDEKDAFQALDENTFVLAVNDNVNEKENSKLILIDRETLKVKKEVEMEKGFHPVKLKILKDSILAVSFAGKLQMFDKKMGKKNSFNFYAGNDNKLMNDVQFTDREMYVLLKNFDIQRDKKLGDMTSYDLKSGKKLKTIPLKAKKEWEIARFEILK
ncbi:MULTISPECIES: hypothetical protein [Bacillus amyloliquefaciens group]|uniref:hypothetical protein n=1 Tax=Bacillus amyloliquefaciens group TaxID=1938374 RepID=UPI0013629CD1|nr:MULTISPECIES: hypothetical protein [Bacillus amyloliquefaciens group]MBO3651615.1 hypothetical protein [Bacillus amyloliquefaciens]MCJ2175456.1 hypothetical protein [Bacillus amyloliquefaciens]MCR4350527.1 hypothetical protein [Bacillus amyloliquefaciens]MCR4357634.1 hypothetical protein [Bacillus amyloliquefaciens]MEC1480910.1 hypothetical protein [Bacillus velezensis]